MPDRKRESRVSLLSARFEDDDGDDNGFGLYQQMFYKLRTHVHAYIDRDRWWLNLMAKNSAGIIGK